MRHISVLTKCINMLSAMMIMALCVLYVRCYHSSNIRISGRYALTIIFVAGATVFGLLFILKRFPRFFPFPVKITPKNMAFQAALSGLFLAAMSLFMTLVFICALYSRYRELLYSPEEAVFLPAYIPAAACALCIICMAIYIIFARKHK